MEKHQRETDNNNIITFKDILVSFKTYLKIKWEWLGLPSPTDLQYEIAEFLQNSGDRRLIEGFRGVAKTWITASYCEWLWLRDRDRRIVIISGAQRKSDEISLFIKNSIDNFPVLKPLRHPEWEKMHARWGIQQFNVYKAPPDVAPSCKAMSVLGMIVGTRATDIVGDDIETPENSSTVESRDKLLSVLGEFENVLLPGGTITLLGTPQSEESIYNSVQDKGYSTIIIPARIPEENKMDIYRGRLSPRITQMIAQGLPPHTPTEPTRFPQEVLIQKESGMSRSAWRLQMMLDSTLSDSDRYPLKLVDIMVAPLDNKQAPLTIVWGGGYGDKYRITDIENLGFRSDKLCMPQVIGTDPESWKPYERKVLFIDPSGKGDNETSWCVLGTLGGRIFVLDFGGFLDGYGDNTLSALTLKAAEHSVSSVVYEENMGSGMFGSILGQHMRTKYPVGIEAIRATGQKERRILDTLEPVLRSHKLIIDYSAIRRDAALENKDYSLQRQLTRITRERGCLRYDDRVDCLSMGVKYFMDSAGVNSEIAQAESEERLRREYIDRMLNTSKVFLTQGITKGREPKFVETRMGKRQHKWNSI